MQRCSRRNGAEFPSRLDTKEIKYTGFCTQMSEEKETELGPEDIAFLVSLLNEETTEIQEKGDHAINCEDIFEERFLIGWIGDTEKRLGAQPKSRFFWPPQCVDTGKVYMMSAKMYAATRASLCVHGMELEIRGNEGRVVFDEKTGAMYSEKTKSIILPMEFSLTPDREDQIVAKTRQTAQMFDNIRKTGVVGTFCNGEKMCSDPRGRYKKLKCETCGKRTSRRCIGCSVVYFCSQSCRKQNEKHKLLCKCLKTATDGATLVDEKAAYDIETIELTIKTVN